MKLPENELNTSGHRRKTPTGVQLNHVNELLLKKII